MKEAKLIVLSGFAGSGKTTIAAKYINEHDMAISLEADQFVSNIGNWQAHRDEVRELAFELIKASTRVYLLSGHDVILPYLITDIKEAEDFESIARECNAAYYEFMLFNERAEAIARLQERGKWGIANALPLTEADDPIIEQLATDIETVIQSRPSMIKIEQQGKGPDATYSELLSYLQ